MPVRAPSVKVIRTFFEVSQNGIQMFDCCGYNDRIPLESCIAGVPKSVKPNQESVDSGRKALPISILLIDISKTPPPLNNNNNNNTQDHLPIEVTLN